MRKAIAITTRADDSELQPTARLRWWVALGRYSEPVLQQWWESRDGNGEWRAVPVEFEQELGGMST